MTISPMEMSKACLPPRQPPISDQDRAHPLFPEYQRHRASMMAHLIEASSFKDWLYQRERNVAADDAANHPEFPAFQAWMRQTKGGARRCPAGAFPANFKFWLKGGRW